MPELRNLRVEEVSGVDRPANKRTFLVIKMDDHEVAEPVAASMGDEVPLAQPTPSPDFEENLIRRRLYLVGTEVYDRVGALMETLDGAVRAKTSTLKGIETAIMDFAESVTACIPGLLARMGGDDVTTKIGAKISAERLRRLQTMQRILTEVLSEGGEKPMEGTPQTPVIDATVAKRLADADEAIKKAQEREAELLDRVTKAEQAVETEREDRLVRKHADFIKSDLSALTMTDADATVLRAIEKHCPADVFARATTILKAASAQVAEAALLTRSIGKDGVPSAPKTGGSEFERAVDALVQKGAKPEDAAAQISREQPELFDAYRAASSLKV